MKKYNPYVEICNNNIKHTLLNLQQHVQDRSYKEDKGILIMKNYKNVHNDRWHGVSWEKPHEENPETEIYPHLNHDPKVPDSQHSCLLPWKIVTYGMFTLVNCTT